MANKNLTDIIRRFPYDKEAVDLVADLFRKFNGPAINPQFPFVKEIELEGYGTISRNDFNLYFLSTVSDLPGWETAQIDAVTYGRILSLQKYFVENQTQTLDPTTVDKIQMEWLQELQSKSTKTTFKEALTEQKEEIKTWEEKLKEKTPIPSKETEKTLPEEKPVEESATPNVYITPSENYQPKTITLSKEERKAIEELAQKAKEEKDFTTKLAAEMVTGWEKLPSMKERAELSKEELMATALITAEKLKEDLNKLPPKLPEKTALTNSMDSFSILAVASETAKLPVSKDAQEALLETARHLVKEHNQIIDSSRNLLSLTSIPPTTVKILGYEEGDKIDPEKASSNFKLSGKKEKASAFEIQMPKISQWANTKNQVLRLIENKYPDISVSDKEVNELVATVVHFNGAMKYLGFSALGRYEGKNLDLASASSGDLADMFNFIGGRYGLGMNLVMEGEKPILQIGIKLGKEKIISLGQVSGRLAQKFASAEALIATKGAAVKVGVSKAVSAGLVKLATKTGIQSLISALGSIAPIIGNIIGWIAGELLWRVGVWIKRHWKEIGMALMAIGLIMRLPLLLLMGALTTFLALGAGTVIAGAAAGVSLFIGAVSSIAIGIATTAIVIILSIPILVALILFIINSGAYLYPPGEMTSGGGGRVINDECPGDWPTKSGYLTQGAYSSCSHSVLEAIDIGVAEVPVYAGHGGSVNLAGNLDCYGNTIDIISLCNGKQFITRYAHLKTIGVNSGQTVTKGQEIGISGKSGSCGDGFHLHYDFREVSLASKSYPNNPPFMMREYIPKDVPRGCCEIATCGTSIP